ncbi:MAG TPA: ribonuclease HI family protein [Micropruina sp.]|nr:ribonuclease HI family protein [Micropruina sp.]
MTLIAAADGSALGNPGPSGWGWYMDDDHWASGGWPRGTNNMGELTAVLDLLQQTASADEDLLIYCDSLYAINSITKWMPGWKRKGWKKGDGKPVLNVEIMKLLDAAMQGRRVRFEWVKGHSGHDLNEQADRLANAAAVAFKEGRQPDPGPGFGGGGSVRAGLAAGSWPGSAALRAGSFAVPTGAVDLDAQPDLFAEPEQSRPEAEVRSDEARVIALERLLLTDQVRGDPAALAALLHPDWSEIGRSGRLWTRAEALAETGPLPTPVSLEVIATTRPAPGVILLIWRAVGRAGTTLRSSLWCEQDGHWRQLFHQGTDEP